MTEPRRPEHIPEYAQVCLEAIAASGLGGRISIGGAFGLAHYYEYRLTHDVDAWWEEPVSSDERQALVRTLESALKPFGPVRTRAWGDVVSVELTRDRKAVFSFQIARRSAALGEALGGVWPGGVRVDGFPDLVASKMAALVERGAPRDFRDIYALCQASQTTITQCWEWWRTRQTLAGENDDRQRAVLAIQSHLERLEQARPLTRIGDALERAQAADLRQWFRSTFLHDVED